MDRMRHQRHELLNRRIRLISDIAEDYQENMRRLFRLLEMDLALFDMPPNTNPRSNWHQRESANQPADTNRATRGLYNLFGDTYPLSRSPLLQTFAYLNRPAAHLDQSQQRFTNEEIAQVTTVIQYDPSMDQSQCPISWDGFQPGQEVLRVNGCGHIFGRNALIEWFGRDNRCPVCRSAPVFAILPTRPSRSGILRNADAATNLTGSSEREEDPLQVMSTFENLPTGNGSGDVENVLYETTNYITNRNLSGLANQSAGSTIVNSILDGLVEGLQTALSTNNTGVFEREYTLNLADLLALPSRHRSNPEEEEDRGR